MVVTKPTYGTVRLGTAKKAKKTTGIIPFSGALNPTLAGSLAEFHLLAGKVKKGHTTYGKPVPLSSVLYDPSAHTISLVPKSKLEEPPPPKRLRRSASPDRGP